tara:strand:+ start:272 stop:541 length:270 start_codon:yes stop_codon:yes gene_type:complete
MDERYFNLKSMINAGYTRALKRYNKYHRSLHPEEALYILRYLTRIVELVGQVEAIELSDSRRYSKLFDIQYEVFICERKVHQAIDKEID